MGQTKVEDKEILIANQQDFNTVVGRFFENREFRRYFIEWTNANKKPQEILWELRETADTKKQLELIHYLDSYMIRDDPFRFVIRNYAGIKKKIFETLVDEPETQNAFVGNLALVINADKHPTFEYKDLYPLDFEFSGYIEGVYGTKNEKRFGIITKTSEYPIEARLSIKRGPGLPTGGKTSLSLKVGESEVNVKVGTSLTNECYIDFEGKISEGLEEKLREVIDQTKLLR